jgi:hypothetical protein
MELIIGMHLFFLLFRIKYVSKYLNLNTFIGTKTEVNTSDTKCNIHSRFKYLVIATKGRYIRL